MGAVLMERKKSLNEQALEILSIAEKHGVEQNFFFITTFQRYQVQMKILSDLQSTLSSDSAMVTKEYVKGRENVYTHPAIKEYNNTASGANQTVQTLMKIITTMREDDENGENELLNFLKNRKR